jgi:hypothetical protein
MGTLGHAETFKPQQVPLTPKGSEGQVESWVPVAVPILKFWAEAGGMPSSAATIAVTMIVTLATFLRLELISLMVPPR